MLARVAVLSLPVSLSEALSDICTASRQVLRTRSQRINRDPIAISTRDIVFNVCHQPSDGAISMAQMVNRSGLALG